MTNPAATTAPPSALRAFLASEAAGGIILSLAAALAMIIANSPLGHAYHDVLHSPVSPALTDKLGPMTAHLWINDGLMAIFFLFVGLEIKRELVDGRLSTWGQRRLPVIAAAAGMAVPAGIYLAFAGSEPALVNGWAIPAATDIAFAIGVLALLGNRAPTSLKLFLVTVAIVDDMGAVAIIALFYTKGLNLVALAAAALVLPCCCRESMRQLPAFSRPLPYRLLPRRVHLMQPTVPSTGSNMPWRGRWPFSLCHCSALPMPGWTSRGSASATCWRRCRWALPWACSSASRLASSVQYGWR